MTTLVTGWSKAGWAEYAETFVEVTDAYWPLDVKVVTYVNDAVPLPERFTVRSPLECEGLSEFLARHGENPVMRGKQANQHWKVKDHAAGYGWRWDVCRWVYQVMQPEHAAGFLPDGEILAWIDADVETLQLVPDGWLDGLLGDADLVYLGREGKHSDIGLWAVRLCPWTRRFLTRFADYYRDDLFRDLPEWHSAYVFDRCVQFSAVADRTRNLLPDCKGQMWHDSPFAPYTEHNKGKRKRYMTKLP
jgi:hypothetical protein